ncbi:MAG: helix-turn-helix transcriptional regulator [Saonia sp.]
MDIHVMDSIPITEEDAYKSHLRDLAVQDKYGLIYKKYYINFQHNTIFCLMDGPSKEACLISHEAAHGIGPCNIVEVSPEFEFHPYLGEGTKNDKDLALTLSGEIDTGYRTLMMICLADFTGNYGYLTDEIYRLIQVYHGNKVMQPDDKFIASFLNASDAISCSIEISHLLNSIPNNIEYNMALVTGKPVDEVGSTFFGEARKRLRTLCRIGLSKLIYIDAGTRALIQKETNTSEIDKKNLKFISKNDFSFLMTLYEILDSQILNSNFKSEDLSKELGLSKSQTYRKIRSLIGMSPNTLIREMRLRRSLGALKKNSKTVAEIAYDLGFNSPTYFTRVFRSRYNTLPTNFAKLSLKNDVLKTNESNGSSFD